MTFFSAPFAEDALAVESSWDAAYRPINHLADNVAFDQGAEASIQNPDRGKGVWGGGEVRIESGLLVVRAAEGIGVRPDTGAKVRWRTKALIGADAQFIFPKATGSPQTVYVFVQLGDDPTTDVSYTGTITVSASTPSGNSQIQLATVLIPAGDNDPTHWTITLAQTGVPHGFGIPGTGPRPGSGGFLEYPAHPDGALTIFLGHDWDGIDVHEAPVTSTALVDLTSVAFPLLVGNLYTFRFAVLFRSADVTTGLKVGLTFPSASVFACNVRIPVAADGTAAELTGRITSSGDSVVGTTVEAAATTYEAIVEGTILPAAAGNLQPQVARGGTNHEVKPMTGCNGRLELVSFPSFSV